MVRQAYVLHSEDDDWGQAGTLVRDVFDDAGRDRFVDNAAGSLAGVRSDVLERALQYWRNVDDEIGARIEAKVKAEASVAESPSVTPEAVLPEPEPAVRNEGPRP